MAGRSLIAVDFEVFGRVQGVFFRKYTKDRAKQLRLHGWVRNTDDGTVTGQLEGEAKPVSEMKEWLQHTGSPHSKISKCNFSNEKTIQDYSMQDFVVRH